MNTQSNRFDVMEGINSPMRVLQWATKDQVEAYCARTDRVIVSDVAIGLVLREVTVVRRSIAEARGLAQ